MIICIKKIIEKRKTYFDNFYVLKDVNVRLSIENILVWKKSKFHVAYNFFSELDLYLIGLYI